MTEDQAWDYLEIQQQKRTKCLQMMSKIQSNEGQQYFIQNLVARINELEAQVHEAVLSEREKCAQVCEALGGEYGDREIYAEWCAQAIRARNNT